MAASSVDRSAGAGSNCERLEDFHMDLIEARWARADLAWKQFPEHLLTGFRKERDNVPPPERPE